MPKKMSRRSINVKKKSALRRQMLRVNPVTFGLVKTLEMKNKAVIDSLEAKLAAQ